MQPTDEAGQSTGPGYFAPVAKATYICLTTFRRSGLPVSTAVHVAMDGDAAYFRTWDVSGKAKRLRHTDTVRIAPSTSRGRPTGPELPATARLLDGADSERAASVIAARHPFLHGRLIPWYHRRRGWITQQYRLDPPAPAP